MRRAVLLALVLAVLPSVASARPLRTVGALANRCVVLKTGGGRKTVFVKPSRLHHALLYTRHRRLLAGTEWKLTRVRGGFHVRSATGRRLGRRVRAATAHGCKRFPEARLDARGRAFRGTRHRPVWGFVDAHLHITADLRAGGRVISGTPFARFGIQAALGRDAAVHGPDGSLDITGNLLRTGSLTGTHDTHGWPTFAGWPTYDTYTHQQVYYRWLQRAYLGGLRLVVAQTVEDAPLCRIEPRRSHSCDETATIGLEVRELHRLQNYVDAQAGGRGRGWFRLVTTPRQARRVIRHGRLAVIIGVESSDVFGCSERLGVPQCDRAQIDAGIAHLRSLGIRTVFLAHWVDNALAGAALEGGGKGAFIATMEAGQTGHPFTTGPCPHPSQGEVMPPLPGRRCNTRGLTPLGVYAVHRLMRAHMLIEVDHASEVARDEVLKLAAKRHYPLVSSHTDTGGHWTAGELRQLYRLGGFATARLDAAPAMAKRIVRLGRLQHRRRPAVGLGTDTGGFAALPGPDPSEPALHYPFRSYDRRVTFHRQRTGTRRFDLNTDGVAHYGLLPDLLARVQRAPHGRRAMRVLFRSAAAYLATWRRTGLR